MSWQKVRLGDILKRRKESIRIEPDGNYKLVTIKLYHKGVILRRIAKGSEIGSSMFVVKAGDFILSGIDARNGAFGIVPVELDDAIVTNDFWCLDPVADRIDKEFLFYLTTTDFFDFICKQSSDGTTQRIRLQKDRFFNYEIDLPSVEEQRLILMKLKTYDRYSIDIANELTNQNEIVKQLRQAFLKEALQGKLTLREKSDGHARDLLEQIKKEKAESGKKKKPLPPIKPEDVPFEIPDKWVWCRLGDIITYTENLDIQSRLDSNQLINYVDIDSIDNNKQIIREIKQKSVFELSSRARRVLKKGFIIYSTVRPYLRNIAIIDDDLPYFIGSTGFNVFSTTKLNSKFVFYFLLSPDINDHFKKLMVGFNSPSITNEQFETALIPLPPLAEQERIIKKLDELMKYCDDLEQSIAESQSQIDMLLQQVLRETLQPPAALIGKPSAEVLVPIEILPVTASLPPLGPVEKSHYVKRKVLATYIINQSLDDTQFGDVKFEKLLHLSDYHILKRNLGQKYFQKAAGPYDNAFTIPYFQQIESAKWFVRKKKGNQYTFSAGTKHDKSLKTYNYYSASELDRIDKLIVAFKAFDYTGPEIVSTLYAVWNNRIILQQEITDELLIADFYDWDKQKEKYPKERLIKALNWMRDTANIIPDGWGKLIEKPKKYSQGK